MTGGRLPGPGVWIAAGAGGLAVAALLIVSFVSMRRDAAHELCRGHLAVIYLGIRSGDLLDSPRWDEVPPGRAFLASQSKWPTLQRRPLPFCCPVKGTEDDLDYRGPAVPLRRIPGDSPLCADREGNHGPGKGGNVLLKTGDVYAVAESHPLWIRAAQTTSD